RRGFDAPERIAREVRTSSARDDGAHGARKVGGRDQRRAAAGAGAEETEAQVPGFILFRQPMRRAHQALREQTDVESQMAARRVVPLLLLRQQIEQQSPEATQAEAARDKLVARAMAAAAAAVREDHQTLRSGGDDELALEFDGAGGDANG